MPHGFHTKISYCIIIMPHGVDTENTSLHMTPHGVHTENTSLHMTPHDVHTENTSLHMTPHDVHTENTQLHNDAARCSHTKIRHYIMMLHGVDTQKYVIT